jgi:hypothetical protein
MPAIMEPLDDGRILLYRVTPPWSIEEVLEIYRDIEAFFDQAASTVHVLIDLSQLDIIHAGALRARHTPFGTHPNVGKIATVTGNDITRILAQSVIRLSRTDKVKLFSNPDEALSYLRQMVKEELSA